MRDGRWGTVFHPPEGHLLHDRTLKVMNSLILRLKNCIETCIVLGESDRQLFSFSFFYFTLFHTI